MKVTFGNMGGDPQQVYDACIKIAQDSHYKDDIYDVSFTSNHCGETAHDKRKSR